MHAIASYSSKVASKLPGPILANGQQLKNFSSDWVFESLARHGAILFRDFNVTPEEFHEFASSLTQAFTMSASKDRAKVDPTRFLETASLGEKALAPHFEFGNHPFRPDHLWFYCLRPATQGGETTVHDGASIFDRLPKSTQELLKQRHMRFTDYLPLHTIKAAVVDEGIRRLIGGDVLEVLGRLDHLEMAGITSDDRVVLKSRLRPAARRPDGRWAIRCNLIPGNDGRVPELRPNGLDSTHIEWDDGTDIDPDLFRQVDLAMNQEARSVRWQAGDFVLIDNNWVLHGRNAWSGGDRRLLSLAAFSKQYRFSARHARGEPDD